MMHLTDREFATQPPCEVDVIRFKDDAGKLRRFSIRPDRDSVLRMAYDAMVFRAVDNKKESSMTTRTIDSPLREDPIEGGRKICEHKWQTLEGAESPAPGLITIICSKCKETGTTRRPVPPKKTESTDTRQVLCG